MRLERRTIARAEWPAYEADGWTIVREERVPERGTDLLVERESVTVPTSRLLVLSSEHRARLDAYAAALGSDSARVVEGWIDRHCSALDVYRRAATVKR